MDSSPHLSDLALILGVEKKVIKAKGSELQTAVATAV